MTLPGPPLGCSTEGGGIMEAGDDGSGAANSDDVSISSPLLEDWVELRDDLPDLRGLDIIFVVGYICNK